MAPTLVRGRPAVNRAEPSPGRGATYQRELLVERPSDARLEVVDVDGVAEDRGGRGDSEVADATGVDQCEVRQVGLQVDGEAVQADPVALGDADGSDLAGGSPDAHMSVVDVCRDADLAERLDDRQLERMHVARHAQPAGAESHNGIADELPRPVIGDETAARRALDADAELRQRGFSREDVLGRPAASERDDRRMLEQQQRVANLVAQPPLHQLVLEPHGVGVANAPQVTHLEPTRRRDHVQRAPAAAGWGWAAPEAARRGGPTWTGRPRATIDASMDASPSVGWAWIVLAMSSSVASSWIARTPSGIRSLALGPM